MRKPAFGLFFLASGSVLLATPDWTQWRGPTRDGQIHQGAKPWPARLSAEGFKKQWSAPLAEGYASPIVDGERIFTVETKGKQDEIVRAFDRATGKQLWETSWAGSMKVPFFAAKNGSWVRSTPACDGETLFVGGMLDVLVAIDVKTGNVKWRTDFPQEEETPKPQFGFVSPPSSMTNTSTSRSERRGARSGRLTERRFGKRSRTNAPCSDPLSPLPAGPSWTVKTRFSCKRGWNSPEWIRRMARSSGPLPSRRSAE